MRKHRSRAPKTALPHGDGARKAPAGSPQDRDQRYRTLIEQSSCIVLEWDPEGDILFLNPYGLEFFGFAPEEILGRNVVGTIVAPVDNQGQDLRIKMKMVQKAPDEFTSSENENVRKNGEKVWVAWTNRGIRNSDGRLVKTISVGIDRTRQRQAELGLIQAHEEMDRRVRERTRELAQSNRRLEKENAERRRIEEALRASEEKHRLLAENILDVIYQLDAEGLIVHIGPQVSRYGYRPEDLVGRGFLEFLHPEDRPRLLRELGEVMANDSSFLTEFRIIDRDGNTAWVEEYGRLLRDGQGRVIGTSGILRDISQRKRDSLRLQQAIDDLKHSNRELQQFAYAVSHDFQEPLRMIASFLQVLETKEQARLDLESREYIGYAVGGAQRLSALVSDLLAFSRLETQADVLRPVDLHSALGEALANLRQVVEESGAIVTNGDLPTLPADRGQMVQLFQNLVGNALKFRGEKPPRVHIEAVPADNLWTISVKDNGIGIEEQYHDRIFQVFQRLHSRDRYPGTGIGLALCRRIVERHGGRIRVESKPGSGSSFIFTLPALQEAANG